MNSKSHLITFCHAKVTLPMISDNPCLHAVNDVRKACFLFCLLHCSQSVCVCVCVITCSRALICTIAWTDAFIPPRIRAAFSDYNV